MGSLCSSKGFNTQPPEGGCCEVRTKHPEKYVKVSTHSRPKAADKSKKERKVFVVFQHTAARRRLGFPLTFNLFTKLVSTHSRPKAAALAHIGIVALVDVSTHSRPKAAGYIANSANVRTTVSTHSRPKAAVIFTGLGILRLRFQHTAARRRLSLS